MLNIAVCDDDKAFARFLQKYLSLQLKLRQEEANVQEFFNAESLLKQLCLEHFHIIFTDIKMPGMDGFQLAREICRLYPKTYLVFVSGHEDLVFQSYRYQPFWFIRKQELTVVMKEVIDRYLKKEQMNQVRRYVAKKKNYVVRYDQILYIEYHVRNLIIHTIDGQIEVYGSLKEEEEALGKCFIRCHKGYLVNMRHIRMVGTGQIQLTDNSLIPLSRNRRTYVRKIILEEL